MATTALATAAAALWPKVRQHLINLGRWLIRRLSTKGVAKVLAFMELRIETFIGRRERARTDRRKKWLTGRIERWRRAMKWIGENVKRLAAKVLAALDRRAEQEKLPWDSRGEIAPTAARP